MNTNKITALEFEIGKEQEYIAEMELNLKARKEQVEKKRNEVDSLRKKPELSQKEIIHNNKIIADFMGYEYKSVDNDTPALWGFWKKDVEPNTVYLSNTPNYNYLCGCTYDMKYHCSMDWLLPVIDQIKGMGFIIETHADKTTTAVQINNYKGKRFYVQSIEGDALPLVTWKCIVLFVKHFNSTINK